MIDEERFQLTCLRGHVSEPQMMFNGGDPVWICTATFTAEERAALFPEGVFDDDLEECRLIIRRAEFEADLNRWR